MEFEITIQGRGGHGSRPDLCSNPVDCFTAIYTAVQSLGCQFRWVDGGTSANIIPDTLTFAGSCDEEAWGSLQQTATIVSGIYHCTIVLNDKGEQVVRL